jgi:hypothetical protein
MLVLKRKGNTEHFKDSHSPVSSAPNIWQLFGNRPQPDTARHSATKKAGGQPNRVESAKKKGLIPQARDCKPL